MFAHEYFAKVFDLPVLWRVRPIIQSRLESIPESALVALNEPSQIRCARVTAIDKSHDPPLCTLTDRTTILLPRILANCITLGDEIVFPLPTGDAAGPEVLIAKSVSKIGQCLYLAPIGYVSQPKVDKHNQQFVSAEVLCGGLGVSSVYLPCWALRDYFYRLPLARDRTKHPTFYELLAISSGAAPAEMRVAFKLRQLELEVAGAPRCQHVALERAFNIVSNPELRTYYDALVADPDAPAAFPYGGFGSLLVDGVRSPDGKTFFAQRILAFLPERRQRGFRLPLRHCDFYVDRAICRDARRKLEFWLDPALLHTPWDPTWNQWKHLLGAKMEVHATFIESGKWRKRGYRWELFRWETALPSRLTVGLPADFDHQVETARSTYHRFGQYARALDQIRLCLEHRAIEKTELERICAGLRIPGDFDIAQINWRPDYDEFFYRQLSRRARRVYLFRGEYIFDVEKAVVVETPQLGHATYVFAKPRTLETFLHLYTKITKDDIRHNRDNAGERLGFLKRVIHGSNPRAWLKEIRQYLGEKVDFVSVMSD